MKRFRLGVVSLTVVVLMAYLVGCATLAYKLRAAKGSLVGNAYTVYQYDNTGNQTMVFSGQHVDIEPYQPKSSSEGVKDLTSVLDITIDGGQMLGVGNTLLFEEKGLDKLAGFTEIAKFADDYSKTGLHFIPYDKFINKLTNSMGKSRLILVYSQMGEPLAMYQGDKVYVTVPEDLPKMTRLNIDGKSLYLHRVNYTIVDTKLMKK